MRPVWAALKAQLRYWQRHRVQALLCLLGVVLGVAVFTAIRLANGAALRAFDEGVQALAGRATHVVRSPAGAGVPDAVVARLLALPQVRAASPTLEAAVRAGDPPLPFTVIGLDPFLDAPFRQAALLSGAGTDADGVEGAGNAEGSEGASGGTLLERFLSEPDALVLAAPLARRLGVTPGDVLELHGLDGAAPFRVLATFAVPEGRNGLARTALLDIAAFQERFGEQGRVDAVQLLLRGDGTAAQDAAAEAVAAALPPGLSLEPIGRESARVSTMSAAFRLNLEVLGLFALVVAAFLIFNAATFAVVQRRHSLAVLRSLGATPLTLFGTLVLEAALLGAAGGALGVLAGTALAQLMTRTTSATFFEVILLRGARETAVHADLGTWALGLLLGAGVSVAGALKPALEGAAVSPMAAIRGTRAEEPRPTRLRAWLGLGLLFLGTGAALCWPGGRSLVASLAGATLLALGGAALCPPLLSVVSRWGAEPLDRIAGVAGRLAARQMGRSLGRTGLAAAALMVALSLALAIQITVGSFRQTFALWLQQTVRADLYLSTASESLNAAFPEDLLARVLAQPFVADSTLLISRELTLPRRQVLLAAMDPLSFAQYSDMPLLGATREAGIAGLAAGGLWMSESLAYALRLEPGDAFDLPTRDGPLRLPIVALVQNYSVPAGVLYLSMDRYADLFGQDPPSRVALWLQPGTAPAQAIAALEALPGAAHLRITDNAAVRADGLRIFDRTFAITDLMGALAAFVAFIAVVSALTALLEERTRTLGYLRAIGVSRATLGLSLGIESLLMALSAALMSWGVGFWMAAVLIHVVNRRAFGWSLQFLPGQGNYLELLLSAAVAALLGSAYPLYRATRLSITATIREE